MGNASLQNEAIQLLTWQNVHCNALVVHAFKESTICFTGA